MQRNDLYEDMKVFINNHECVKLIRTRILEIRVDYFDTEPQNSKTSLDLRCFNMFAPAPPQPPYRIKTHSFSHLGGIWEAVRKCIGNHLTLYLIVYLAKCSNNILLLRLIGYMMCYCVYSILQ